MRVCVGRSRREISVVAFNSHGIRSGQAEVYCALDLWRGDVKAAAL